MEAGGHSQALLTSHVSGDVGLTGGRRREVDGWYRAVGLPRGRRRIRRFPCTGRSPPSHAQCEAQVESMDVGRQGCQHTLDAESAMRLDETE